ncbi:MAG: cyanophycinase [Ignavibacterium sp.]|jgi:cyanophycinase|nr:MAG: cyanophycinase [Ignavibacterium sp.]MDD5607152.1 cyanophycinase [Ignavibacterium sp.]MDX9713608.1 cyanophycinase [Ignavibacteriaceae bacterium]MEB2355411.1 cyanophycinase [Ignavibacteriales bacterium]GIK20632.1 MAG: cyanophycinase [Ignavibacteriota bacterium]
MKRIILGIIIILLTSPIYCSQTKGKLVIVGGVQTTEIVKKYVELAGGSNAKIIVIPNAGSDPVYWSEVQVKEFNDLGAQAQYLLFTKETADDKSNLDKMDWANAVFFLGGDQSVLTHDMLGTKLLQKVFDIYNNGGVVGGSSAGAAVMSEVMITGNELVNKDSSASFVTIERGNVEVKRGFGFLKNVIVDQHFLKRKRHNRTISALIEHPDLFGIAIDESTAIIVYPDETFEVIGSNQVLVYDPTNGKNIREDKNGNLGITDMKLQVLISGDKFDMKTKQVIK